MRRVGRVGPPAPAGRGKGPAPEPCPAPRSPGEGEAFLVGMHEAWGGRGPVWGSCSSRAEVRT
jgi:hypothetical protein